ncbi:carbohydrate ABC transporter permease [Micromonospora sp. R77]|uniref:carbohydrate ABC transporter permease n=1 Tax=Micromonospora sp. R77 TaxID=2925836 RepID=UPI001F6075F3|nr:carbohydrate ABC transporter permease [Micromonospora sp. R77]MCI4065914.1 carbohydrate ABC transporter permease [Micromonospora sp. R77]
MSRPSTLGTTRPRQPATAAPPGRTPTPPRRRRHRGVNLPAGVAATLWLLVVVLPLYYILVTSLRTPEGYLTEGALALPRTLSLDNYARVLGLGFPRLLVNSLVVTVSTVVLVLALALPAAYAIVRGVSRAVRVGFSLFLLGLAIPAQAVVIPIYLIITRLRLYDSLLAIILPTVAFALPMSVVVLTSTLRDIPVELYEAMTVDGAGPVRVFGRLVVPLARPGLISIGIFSGLGAWNGFLFPLVLTQSPEQRVLPLGLWNFQNQFGTDVPGLMALVVFSALPVLTLYLFGRRHLLGGLTAGFGK